MKKIFLPAILIFAISAGLNARSVKMSDVFRQMPDTLLPYLSQNNRLDMIDFKASGMDADIMNGFDEHTRLNVLTDNYMNMTLSQASSLELKLLDATVALPDSADCIVCVVHTVGTDRKSSTVKFYTSRWTELAAIPCPLPDEAKAFIARPDTMGAADFEKLEQSVYPVVAYANLSEVDDTLTIGLSLPAVTEEEKRIKAAVKQITLKWTGDSFKES